MTFEEKTLSSERIYEGAILNLRKDKVVVTGGNTSYREIVEHRGGVALAAVTDDKNGFSAPISESRGKGGFGSPGGKIESNEGKILYLRPFANLRKKRVYGFKY